MIAAANAGDLAAVTRLADEDPANVGPLTESGVTALFLAAKNGHAHLLPSLLERMDPRDVNRGPNDRPPLFVAVTHGHTACIDALLACPAVNGHLAHRRASWLVAAQSSGRLDALAVPLLQRPRLTMTARDFAVLLRQRRPDWLSAIAPYGSPQRGAALASAAEAHKRPDAFVLAARWGAELFRGPWHYVLAHDEVAVARELVELGQSPPADGTVAEVRSEEMLRVLPHDRALLVDRLRGMGRTLVESLAGSPRTAALVRPLLLRLSPEERRDALTASWRGRGWRPSQSSRGPAAALRCIQCGTSGRIQARADAVEAVLDLTDDEAVDADLLVLGVFSSSLYGASEALLAGEVVHVVTSHRRVRPLTGAGLLRALARFPVAIPHVATVEAALRARHVGRVTAEEHGQLARRVCELGMPGLERLARAFGAWGRRGPVVVARSVSRGGGVCDGDVLGEFLSRRCPERPFRVVVAFI